MTRWLRRVWCAVGWHDWPIPQSVKYYEPFACRCCGKEIK